MHEDDGNPVQLQFSTPEKRADPPTPLVLVHDGGGTIFSYFLLGSLDRDVWAIHNPKLFDDETWDGGVDEMARHYIQLLVTAGWSGAIMLGGWSLGGLISHAMAHMLAQDPSTGITVAGILAIDAPFHSSAESNLATTSSEPKQDDMREIVRKAFDDTEEMLKKWDLPSWQGPFGGEQRASVSIAGRRVTLGPGHVLYKPPQQDWTMINTQAGRHGGSVTDPIAPPPGVLIRCTRPAAKVEGSGPEPVIIDLHRGDTLLGWEGNYADYLVAVIDVDDGHYTVFDKYDDDKMQNLTSKVKAGLEILDSLQLRGG